MRISDWSSDVCSSDLGSPPAAQPLIPRPSHSDLPSHGEAEALLVVVRLRQRVPSEASVMVAAFPRRSRHLLFSASSRHLTTVAHMGSGCRDGSACQAAHRYWTGGLLLRSAEPLATRHRSEENTSELKSLMRTSYAVFCL